MTLAEKIAALRRELAALEQCQRAELLRMMATAFPPGEVFSAMQVWLQPELRTACLDAGLHSPQSLGKHLRRWCGHGITRVGVDEHGVLWTCAD